MRYDFGGYATKANIRCADGRIIDKGAFSEDDGRRVPLVWQHQRNNPENVLGHAILENRDDGVYAYCVFNDSDNASIAKTLVEHGDVTQLSIYANHLTQNGSIVKHGIIREVSLVLAGANPGANIDNVCIAHSDGGDDEILKDEAVIRSGENFVNVPGEIEHAANQNGSDKTIQEVFDSLTDEQKNVVYAMLGYALDHSDDDDEDPDDEDPDDSEDDEDSDDEDPDEDDPKTKNKKKVEHSIEGGDIMKKNVFEGSTDNTKKNELTHADIDTIFSNARKYGSLAQAVKEVCIEHGIENLEILFPEAKTVTPTPDMIARDQEWVTEVWNRTRKSPFSRVKSVAADLTKDEARAKGYIKGKRKEEETFALLKRVTTPQTVYKKQGLDRDDIIDITDFDVIAWMKAEMRMMLNEELARAVLVGDGRVAGAEDKINETNIRPIYTDDDLYAIHHNVAIASNATNDDKADAIIEAANRSRKNYKGSGSPVFYTDSDTLTTMLLAKDKTGRRLYNTVTELAAALRVTKIVEVPVMENLTRTVEGKTLGLLGIIVNLTDYVIGADRGGAVTMFDDFDIDYNRQKYLIETRCSGALVKPYSAIVLETEVTAAG